MTLARVTFLSFLCLTLASAACGGARQPTECQSIAECPSGSRCGNGVCRAAARPVAAVAPLAPVETYALVTLDGSPSHDPDGGSIVAHRWTFASIDAKCAAPSTASAGASASVRFACTGEYEVSLVVLNDLGLESEALTTTLRAYPSSGSPLVSAGPDQDRDHVCAGSPLKCTTADAVMLAAEANGRSITWSVVPPLGRPLSDSRRVRFDPDAAATAPQVLIESDGTAISGDWIFRAEVRDEYGVVGSAFSIVHVKNRAPVVHLTPPAGPFNHSFDAANSVFKATGFLAAEVSDPDGDPLAHEVLARHVGDGGGARFEAAPTVRQAFRKPVPLAQGVTFLVEVPYATAADALNLVGGEGLERTIEVVVRDANGAEARDAVAIEIGNRRPVQDRPAASLSVPHRYDATAQRYVAAADLGAWFDPDGDPLVPSGGAAPCSDISLVNGVVTVTCAVPYRGVPAVDQLAGFRQVPLAVRDPWTDGEGAGMSVIEIGNSPPTLDIRNDPDRFTGWWHTCNGVYPRHAWIEPGDFTTTPIVTDPDGDPVGVRAIRGNGASASPAEQVCVGGECSPVRFHEPDQQILWPSTPAHPYRPPSALVASDGGTIGATREVTPWPLVHGCGSPM